MSVFDPGGFKWIFDELVSRGGEQRRLYCTEEEKITDHVSISWEDLLEILEKQGTKNGGDYENYVHIAEFKHLLKIPVWGPYQQMLFRLVSGRPFMCESCGNLKKG